MAGSLQEDRHRVYLWRSRGALLKNPEAVSHANMTDSARERYPITHEATGHVARFLQTYTDFKAGFNLNLVFIPLLYHRTHINNTVNRHSFLVRAEHLGFRVSGSSKYVKNI